MFPEKFSLFPDQASNFAESRDHIFFFILMVTGLVAIAITVFIIYFAIRYRRRSPQDRTPRIMGSTRLEAAWSIIPFFFFMAMFGWGAVDYFSQSVAPPGSLEVYVVGKQWMWKIQHAPGGQREINQLHIPLGQPVKLTLASEDVIHDFFVPAFRTHIDVVPGRFMHTWFRPTKLGTFHLYCSQYCGTAHSNMVGSIIVMEPNEYQNWLNGQPDRQNLQAEGSLALEGRKLFLKLQCISCHGANPEARAPVLEDLFMSPVNLEEGPSVTADEDYIRESIRQPRAKIVQGWKPIMPAFGTDQVSEEDLILLVEYIKNLKRGDTPVRTEEFPPPLGAPTTSTEQGNKP